MSLFNDFLCILSVFCSCLDCTLFRPEAWNGLAASFYQSPGNQQKAQSQQLWPAQVTRCSRVFFLATTSPHLCVFSHAWLIVQTSNRLPKTVHRRKFCNYYADRLYWTWYCWIFRKSDFASVCEFIFIYLQNVHPADGAKYTVRLLIVTY